MRILLVVLFVLVVIPAFAQTYTTEEFVVEGQPTTTVPTTTTPVYTTGAPVYTVPASGATVVTTPGAVVVDNDLPIYKGMSAAHCKEVMGDPTYVEKFRKFRARKQGIYDEIWTYEMPTGPVVVYIKERRILKLEY